MADIPSIDFFNPNTELMMKRFPFTTEGVQEANTYFYNLSQDALWAEVYAVQQDLRLWVTTYFDIQGQDLDCLKSFNAPTLFVLSNQLAVTLSLRLPFRLEWRQRNPNMSLLGAKRGKNHNPIGIQTTGPDTPLGEGEFVYIIE